MTLVRWIARPMLSSMFISGGFNSVKNAAYLTERAKPVTDRIEPLLAGATASLPVKLDATNLVRLNGLIELVGGLMLARGRAPRLTSLVLVATLVPTTLAGHRYWEESDPRVRANQRVHLLKNVSMAGGLLLASVDTEGRPSLTWRAKRQAARATKRAAQLADR
ncbi:MAG: DoxX family protein [Nocardioidaceae bacterium]